MLQIKIAQTDRIEKETGLTCLDDCIATLAHYYGCHYEMMYADGFAVLGSSGEYQFASSYFIRLVNGPRNLTDYHGLTLHRKEFYTKRRVKKLIRSEIEEGRPVLLLFDPFWCPWDWGFQQYSNEEGHCFLVSDMTDRGLVCADPYFEKEAELLPFEYFQKGIRGIYLVEYTGERSVPAGEYKKCLEKLFVNCRNQKYFEGLHSFIDEIAYREDIFNEVQSDELFWRSPLVGILLRMNQSIQSISGFVRYVAEQLGNEDLLALGERIWNLAITWKQARKLITKLYFMKRPDECLKEKTVQKMRLVIQELETMPERIQEIFCKENCVKESVKIKVGKSGKTPLMAGNGACSRQLDLTCWMNNKAFMYVEDLEKDNWKADFSSIGHCYLLDDEEHRRDIWQAGGIAFAMGAVYGNEKDNIICDGQKIPVGWKGCQSFALIGSAEFGCSTEIMRITGEDGQEYEMEFHMTDYIYEPYYGETVAWTGKGAYKKEDGYEIMPETLYLYSQTYALPVENISFLELPINPSIHIFGITFICG